jgi:hypothetical protein
MPRSVPATLSAQLTIGSVPGLVALPLLLASLVVAWILVPMTDVAALWAWGGDLTHTSGHVVSVHRTGIHVNHRTTLAVEFEHDGRRATSYATGVGALRAGEVVDVEYPVGRPERARIAGMRAQPMSPWLLLTFTPPLLAGLVLLGIAIVLGRRGLRLLRDGAVTTGTLVAREPTSMRVNGRRVYRLVYDYRGSDGHPARAVGRTHRVAERTEAQIVYDPDGRAAIPIGCLPGQPSIGPDDTVAAASVTGGVIALVLLAIVVAGWVALLVVNVS